MASKANGVEEWIRAPPPPGTCFSRFMNAIYNPEEHSFLGRTPKRWGMFIFTELSFYILICMVVNCFVKCQANVDTFKYISEFVTVVLLRGKTRQTTLDQS